VTTTSVAIRSRFHHVPFWVQIHGPPLDMLNKKNAAKMEQIGGSKEG